MKKYSNFLIVFISIIFLIFIFIKKDIVNNAIITSLSLWLNTLVPSMFPMFVLSDILINYNFIDYIPKKIVSTISKIFNISKPSVLILFLSLISGFPSNARNIKTAYEKNLISKKEAEHILAFNHFANPLFVIQTVGTFFLKNTNYGLIILFSHIISNFIIGFIIKNKNTITKINDTTIKDNCQNFGTILSVSIKKSIDSLFMVAGVATLFLILSSLITNIFSLNKILSLIIKSILEMTIGLSFISSVPLNETLKVTLSTMVISFGGLSVHLQVISALDGSNIEYKNYLKGRLYQTAISGIISFLIMFFIA